MGVNGESKAIRVGIAGAGYMAREHAKAFAALPDVDVVGVWSRTAERARELAVEYGAETFESLSDMYEGARPDVLVVAVSIPAILPVSTEAFRFPWFCLIEKPIGLDLAEARRVVEAAEAAGARAGVALNRRSYGSTRTALAALEGDGDTPRMITVLDQQDMVAAREYGEPEDVVRNYMYANSIHLIDALLTFGRGEVVDVVTPVPWTPEQPAFVVATVRFSSGDAGTYQAVWDGPGPWSVSVTNRARRLELRPVEDVSIQLRGERSVERIERDSVDVDFKPGLLRQAEAAVAAARGLESDLADLTEALRGMELCARIYGLESTA